MAYSVPDLPYDYAALEPHIDEQTMRVHHDKHHQAYVDKANAALEGTEWADKDVDEVLRNLDQLPDDIRTAVRNNGGGHSNHTFFWQIMSPDGGGEPDGDLRAAIDDTFGSFDSFQDEFKTAGVNRFGSGVARARRLGTGRGLDRESGLARLRRTDAAAGRRRLGARVLPQVPEQAPGLHRRLVERRELAGGRQPLRRRRVARNAQPMRRSSPVRIREIGGDPTWVWPRMKLFGDKPNQCILGVSQRIPDRVW